MRTRDGGTTSPIGTISPGDRSAPDDVTDAATAAPAPGAPCDAARRSDVTRRAILASARARFAEDGYERATIRGIARGAHIDPSMVMRYYGCKEQLFVAAAELELRVPPLAGPVEGWGELILRHFLDRWENNLADDPLIALMRSSTTNEQAAGLLREVMSRQAGDQLARALEHAGLSEGALRAGLVGALLVGLGVSRYLIRLEPLASLDVDSLVARFAPSVQHTLTGPLGATGSVPSPTDAEVPS